MNDEELAGVLEGAGLSLYQAAAYVTLLELGTASATDLADVSGVPGPRIYSRSRPSASGSSETAPPSRDDERASLSRTT